LVRARLCKVQKRARWTPDTPASPTTKTGRHDITEILLKVALITKNQNQIKSSNDNHLSILFNVCTCCIYKQMAIIIIIIMI